MLCKAASSTRRFRPSRSLPPTPTPAALSGGERPVDSVRTRPPARRRAGVLAGVAHGRTGRDHRQPAAPVLISARRRFPARRRAAPCVGSAARRSPRSRSSHRRIWCAPCSGRRLAGVSQRHRHSRVRRPCRPGGTPDRCQPPETRRSPWRLARPSMQGRSRYRWHPARAPLPAARGCCDGTADGRDPFAAGFIDQIIDFDHNDLPPRSSTASAWATCVGSASR